MPTEYGLERYLSPAGQQTMGSAIELMRKVGSSRLQQEHLIMVFSGMFPPFSRIGAGPDYFSRMFDVDPAAPKYTGDFTVSDEVRELVVTAATPNDGRRTRRAGPLHLLEAALQHQKGVLRWHLLNAHMQSSKEYDENAPDNLWEEITGRGGQDNQQYSIVA